MFTPKPPVIDKALRRRVVVNFFGGDGGFVGHLAEYDSETYVLDQCETIPNRPDEVAQRIPGRQYVDRINCWLQELPA